MTRLLFFGDTHEDIDALQEVLILYDYDVAFGLGDIITDKIEQVSFVRPTYTILGNHDDLSPRPGAPASFKLSTELCNNIDNLTSMETGEVYSVEGMNVMGINGNFSPKMDESNKDRHYTHDDIDICKMNGEHENIDIFLSHEAPSGLADKLYTGERAGIDCIREIVDLIEPTLSVSAHLHEQQYEVLNKDTIGINIGYGVDGECVIIDTSRRRAELYSGESRELIESPFKFTKMRSGAR